MCLPFFTLAFCAVFTPAPLHSAVSAPIGAVSVVAEAAAGSGGKASGRMAGAGVTPAPGDAPEATAPSQGARGGAQKEGLILAVAQTTSDRRETTSRTASRDSETKGESSSAQESGDRRETEAK